MGEGLPAAAHGFTTMQVLLAFVLHQPNVAAISLSGSGKQTLENAAMLENPLTDEEFDELRRVFPAPSRPVPLDVE